MITIVLPAIQAGMYSLTVWGLGELYIAQVLGFV